MFTYGSFEFIIFLRNLVKGTNVTLYNCCQKVLYISSILLEKFQQATFMYFSQYLCNSIYFTYRAVHLYYIVVIHHGCRKS